MDREFIGWTTLVSMAFLGFAGLGSIYHEGKMDSYKMVTECRKNVSPNKSPDIVCGPLPKFDQ